MNDIGKIIHDHRISIGIDIRELSRRSDVDPGGISRIENGNSNILIDTAIRLCRTLNITYMELLHLNKIKPDHDLLLQSRKKERPFLDANDIQYFMKLSSVSLKRSMKELHKVFSSASGEKEVPLEYPNTFPNEIILEIFRYYGAITIKDVGLYIRNLRKKENLSLLMLQKPSNVSDSTLSKWENASINRFRLIDILNLDKTLQAKGMVLALYWNAIEFQPVIKAKGIYLSRRFTIRDAQIIYPIMGIYRHLLIADNAMALQWLGTLRDES